MTNTTIPGQGAAGSAQAGVFNYKLDLYGSSRTLAFDSNFNTVCVRRGIAADFTNAIPAAGFAHDGLNEVIYEIVLAEGETFPSGGTENHLFFDNLPLDRITVIRWGLKALVSMRYKFHRSSFPNTTADLGSMRTVKYSLPVYRTPLTIDGPTGLPSGPFANGLGDPSVKQPTPYQFARSATQLSIPRQLTFNPFNFGGVNPLGDLVDTTNITGVIFDGHTYAANELRFDGLAMKIEDTNNTVFYNTVFVFTIQRGGHVGQYLDDPIGSTWDTSNLDRYERVWNSSNFP